MIRRILFLVLIPFLAMSCKDIEDNTPALQIVVNGDLFKAENMQYTTEEGGGYTIKGINENSALEIYLTSLSVGTYEFGEELDNVITYTNSEGEFTTDIRNGGGEVRIEELSELDYVTGTFFFRASDTTGNRMQAVNGHIYQVPFGSGDFEIPEIEAPEDGGDDDENTDEDNDDDNNDDENTDGDNNEDENPEG